MSKPCVKIYIYIKPLYVYLYTSVLYTNSKDPTSLFEQPGIQCLMKSSKFHPAENR